ncbi:MAG: hypothetical protein RMJ67_05970 [Elusimicrobiota bacterium]|nr:hypothetical protein [Endomicrobiia bacterium]MDW8166039.1 hypothetical protein [Elusimicrobiota bacterium]
MLKLLSRIRLFKTQDNFKFFALGRGKRHKNYEIFWISRSIDNVNDEITLPFSCEISKTKKGNYVVKSGSGNLIILISSKRIKVLDDVLFIKKLKGIFYIYVIVAQNDFYFLHCGKKYKVDLKQNMLVENDKVEN